jgi:hypothetical protein
MPGRPMPDAVLNDPDVDGLALRLPWDRLEPGDWRFDWAMLDHEFAAAQLHGKKVSLIVMPGPRTPNWVYSAGARQYAFGSCQSQFGGPSPSGLRIPIPWDPVYLAKWTGFIRALGARYAGNPGLSLIKVTGISGGSAELAISRGGPCQSVDAINWQSVGYTREKLLQALRTILDAYAQAFPSTKMALMLVPRPLPPIDSDGKLFTSRDGDARGAEQLIDMGMSGYGSRFVLQNNGLSAFWNWEKIPQVRGRVPVGYQMLWNASGDPQCRMNRGAIPCDPHAVLQAAVNRGIDTGANYLEIYVQDIVNPACRDVIAQAHGRLTRSGAA